ncbi:26S proteasome regulatory complex, subunit RPN3/PSMD3 [Trachipleistophora hominis]|uniref:26S proteasome regulatory complex, subunit RPN3/PSMD3 n=1 Tax=Trachipleistophora hominis TaxID=72359 RepID=L7JSU1_TRAHO|nr:26S proteasome regulatory complex, subunit RPN3/PSMD3 [Trachipleistophora hominis]
MDTLTQILKAPDQQTKCNLLSQHLPALLTADIKGDSLIAFLLKILKMQQREEHAECIKKITKNQNNLSGVRRENDWVVSYIVRACFISMKKLNDYDLRLFCNLLITNRKYGNAKTSLALNNIVLKILIEKKMFWYARNYLNDEYCDDSKYNLYKGIVRCVSMEYEDALRSFRLAMALSDRYTSKVRKYECVTLMLLGRMDKSYRWCKSLCAYKEACDAVKMGDRKKLGRVIEEYKSAFWEDKTFFLVCRLHHLIVQEGIRKISLVYTRISLQDVQEKYGIAEELFTRYVKDRKIRGIVQNGVYISGSVPPLRRTLRLLDTLRLNEKCSERMRYPRIKKINYENYVKNGEGRSK